MGGTHRLELVQLGIRLVRRLVRPRLGQNLCKMCKHVLIVQLVAVKWQALDQLFHRTLRLEREERETKRNVPPLTRVFGQSETLAEFVDDVFSLFFLPRG